MSSEVGDVLFGYSTVCLSWSAVTSRFLAILVIPNMVSFGSSLF